MKKYINKFVLFSFILGVCLSLALIPLIRINIYAIILLCCIPFGTALFSLFIIQYMSKPLEKFEKDVEFILAGELDYPLTIKEEDLLKSAKNAFTMLQEEQKKIINLNKQLQEELISLKEGNTQEVSWGSYFDTLFHSTNHAIFIHELQGKIIDVNEKACKMLGMDKPDLLDTSFLDLYTINELKKCREAIKIGTHSCSVRFESIFKYSDGTGIDVEISSNVVDQEKGIIQSIVDDISASKKMLSALKSSEEKFRSFMETASDLMFIVDKKGSLNYVNQALCDRLSYTQDECKKMNLMDLVTEEYKDEYRNVFHFLNPNADDTIELAWFTKKNHVVVGEMKAIGIFDQTGTFQGIRGIFRDITERKKIQESQRLTQLGRLAADVAHELKNQLTVLYTLADLSLMDDTPMEEMRENMQSIFDQCSHINDVVQRLLMFSKPSKGNYKKVDIHKAIEMVLKLSDKMLMKVKIEIQKQYEPDLPQVNVDEKQMTEVFMNLLHNAAEAMKDGGVIKVETHLVNNDVQIDFIDNGEGISEEAMKKIFDPFFTTKESGTGLGVSACYGILKSHNGDLKYSSQVGEGTTASVLLPCAV